MERAAIDNIREALAAVRTAARGIGLDSCDVDDIEDVIAPAEAELDALRPNVRTLSTYLNSLARSLRSQPAARNAVLQLDAAMRDAGVPTNWEH
jgi:hypothetical protein